MKSFLKRTGLLCLLVLLLPAVSHAEIYSGSCGQDVEWKLDTETGLLEIYNRQPGAYSNMDKPSSALGYAPWYRYTKHIRSVNLSGIFNICSYAFYNCSSLTSITIPDSVTSIGVDAFSGCSGLTSVSIPESVTSIGISAFYNTPWFNNQPDGLVYAGKVAYEYKGTMPSGTHITIEEGTVGITEGAFSGCSGLTSITIPESVTSIGTSAFSGCSGLTSITIPESVTSIGTSAFYGCSGLTSITIPESVTKIENYTFSGCSGLTSVTIPESVNSIGSSAFASCNNLTSVTINSNAITSATYSSTKNIGTIFGAQVKEYIIGGSKIGDYAFYKNSALESITILKSVTSIGEYAFYRCSGLTAITIPGKVTSIESSAFSGCSGLTSVTLNSNAIASALYSSTKNIGTIFGSQVKNYMFGDEVKRIGEYAFASSKEVVSIVLGRNIERLQNNALSGCDKLEEVRVKASEPPIAFSTAFPDNAYYAVLYVPEGTEALYKEDNVWGRFSRIRTFKDEPEKCVLAIKSAIGGYLEMICNTQTSYTFNIKTEKGWQVSSVSFNGADVTANITDDSYTTPLLEGDSELSVIFEMDQDEIDMVNKVETHSQLSVTASASTIYIHNEGAPVNSYIYTSDGKMVNSVVASYGKTTIPLQPNNIYLVKTGTRTFKVAL